MLCSSASDKYDSAHPKVNISNILSEWILQNMLAYLLFPDGKFSVELEIQLYFPNMFFFKPRHSCTLFRIIIHVNRRKNLEEQVLLKTLVSGRLCCSQGTLGLYKLPKGYFFLLSQKTAASIKSQEGKRNMEVFHKMHPLTPSTFHWN